MGIYNCKVQLGLIEKDRFVTDGNSESNLINSGQKLRIRQNQIIWG